MVKKLLSLLFLFCSASALGMEPAPKRPCGNAIVEDTTIPTLGEVTLATIMAQPQRYSGDIAQLPKELQKKVLYKMLSKIAKPYCIPPYASSHEHTRFIWSLAGANNRQHIASASEDGTARIWDMQGKQLTIFDEEKTLWNILYTSDGTKLIATDSEGCLLVWEIETKELLFICEGHTGSVTALRVTADSRRAISASYDGTIRVWDLHNGEQCLILDSHTSSVYDIQISPDGTKLISCSHADEDDQEPDNTVRVWSLETGEQLRVFEGHAHGINRICTTNDGLKIVSCSNDGTIGVRDFVGEQSLSIDMDAAIEDVCISADGSRIIAARGNNLLVLDMEGTVTATCRGHQRPILGVCATHEDLIISRSLDNTIRIWNMDGNQLAVCTGALTRIQALHLCQDGATIVCGLWNGQMHFYDISLLKNIYAAINKGLEPEKMATLWTFLCNVHYLEDGEDALPLDALFYWSTIDVIIKEQDKQKVQRERRRRAKRRARRRVRRRW